MRKRFFMRSSGNGSKSWSEFANFSMHWIVVELYLRPGIGATDATWYFITLTMPISWPVSSRVVSAFVVTFSVKRWILLLMRPVSIPWAKPSFDVWRLSANCFRFSIELELNIHDAANNPWATKSGPTRAALLSVTSFITTFRADKNDAVSFASSLISDSFVCRWTLSHSLFSLLPGGDDLRM